MSRRRVGEGATGRSLGRIVAIACALFMIFVAFQSFGAKATFPSTGAAEYNHALTIHGGTASGSTVAASFVPALAIDGSTTTYWQAGDRVGWLLVSFSPRAVINEVHVHFRTNVFPALSLYYDTNANGLYESSEKVWTTTTNTRLDVVIATATLQTSGMKITIDARVGSKQPAIAEFEAYLRGDTDGDGLTNTDEAAVTYYQDMRAAGVPRKISNAGQDTVLFYNMGTTTADGKMQDLSGRGNDGGVFGTQSVQGKLGAARNFNGVGDQVTVPFSTSLQNQRFTVAAWAYPTAQTGGAIWDSGGRQETLLKGYNLHMDPATNKWRGQALWLTTATPWSNVDSVAPVVLNTWTHVAFTWDGSFLRLYLNGALDNSVAGSGNFSLSSSSPEFIGRLSDNIRFWQGRIDELQVWSRALSPSELNAEFQRTAPILYYDMESRRSTGIQDLAGNGNIGTLSGTTVAEGRLGAALQFNGGSDYLLGANPLVGFPADSMTLAAWVKRTGAGVVFDEQGFGAPNSGWHDSQMEIQQDGTVRMAVWPRTVTLTCGSIDTNWHHLALTYDRAGGAVICFIDGTQRATATMGRDSTGASTYVLGRADTTSLGYGGSFNGIIDEAQIWNVALSASRIRDSVQLETLQHPLDVTLARFYGVAGRALANFTVDDPAKGDLTASIGYWDGSAWVDRTVWDPGRHVSSGPTGGAAVSVSYVAPSPALATLGTLATEWKLGETDSGAKATVVVDLVAPQETASASENASGILRPAFPVSSFFSTLRWRLIVRDWTATGAGDTVDFTMRFEAKTDPGNPDTDGDGISDYDERTRTFTIPVTRDSDLDGLDDNYEITPHDLTLTIDGVTTTVPGLITDPRNPDTDGDGLTDGQERGVVSTGFVTNPRAADTDGDTLPDGAEVYTYHTNPTSRDSDGDTIPDNVELTPTPLTLTVNGVVQTRMITTNPARADTDGDGLRDDQEIAGTTPWGVVTDPTVADTDGDGLADGSEAYMKEFSMAGRAPMGTGGSRTIDAPANGPIDSVEVRYSTSGSDISGLQIRLDHNGVIGPWIRTGGGTGTFLHESRTVTGLFPSQPPTGSYTLTVWAPAGGVVLEEFSILFKIRTDPTKADTDGDGISDKEEIEAGQDGWVTDPNSVDTDRDGWWDGTEIARGTNPLLADTDGDGVPDPQDLDPLHNLMVAVTINRVHHSWPWSTPVLQGVAFIGYNAASNNWDYIYATPRVTATLDYKCLSTFLGICTSSGYTTSAFYDTYYADIPDDRSSLSVKLQGWSYNALRNDDLLAEGTYTYSVGGDISGAFYSGDSWVHFRIQTVYLDKVRTLAVTNGQVTSQAASGAVRFEPDQRFDVLLLRASSGWGQIAVGFNAIVVPESIFAHTYLKAYLASGQTWPLGGATFYDGDLGQATMSKGIAGLIAGDLSGDQAGQVLAWLLQDESGATVYQAVDITGQVFGANLPADVVRILPWVGVVNYPTDSMPEGNFFAKVWNGLVLTGQLIYGGLVAIGEFFVNLGQAIVNWGMRALGAIGNAIAQVEAAIDQAQQVLQKALDWAVNWVTQFIHSLLDPLVAKLRAFLDGWFRSVYNAAMDGFRQLREAGTMDLPTVVGHIMDAAMTGVNLIVAILTTAKLVEIALSYMLGVGLAVGVIASEVFKAVVVAAFTSAAIVGTVVVADDIQNGKRDPIGVAATFAGVTPFREIAEKAYEFVGAVWAIQKTRLSFLMRATGVAFSLLGLGLALAGPSFGFTGFNLLVCDLLGAAVATGGLVLLLMSAAAPSALGERVLDTMARFTPVLEAVLSVIGVVGAFLEIQNHMAGGKY